MDIDAKTMFSWSGLLPKDETQSSTFIANNPLFDGRGIVVGILDTGVDPGAIGLSITSDGKPKVIDIIDCSGSGDVSMGNLVCPDEKRGDVGDSVVYTLKGITGRTLTLNPKWINPTNKYRLGIKVG